MRLGNRESSNVEDRRGRGGFGGFGGMRGGFPGGMRIPIGIGRRGGGIGLVGVLVLVLLSFVFGVDPGMLVGGDSGGDSGGQVARQQSPADEASRSFVARVLADTEQSWHALFRAQGGDYEEPRLVLFTDATSSACGFAQSATGPFYCPNDRKIYLDTGFFRELRDRFGAPGDFAQAYVIAHEVGHHVQTLLGISQQVHAAQQRAGRTQANALSVRLELQADCFAGVWAANADAARAILEQGDVEEGLNAAAAIGDDRLQRQAGRHVAPDSFTHGSAAQRVRWFRRGLDSGKPAACDTFSADAV